MIRAFRKIGGAFKAVGRFIVKNRGKLRVLKNVAVFIPVVGGPMALALDYVESAEKTFNQPGAGKQKMTWVIENLQVALNAAGYKEKRVRGLIEMALLVLKDEAEIRDIEESS